jgi:hypothetical protein
MPKLVAALVAMLCLPGIFYPQAQAQAPGVPDGMPLVVDMTKIDVGSWADYKMGMGAIALSARWALVARDATSNTVEMTTTGAAVAKPVVLRMVLPADPTSHTKLKKPMVVQFGHDDPMLAPPDTPAQRFQRPDDNNLVGKEEIKVAAGTFQTRHYREKNAMGTVDIWVSENVPPLGVVKVLTTPEVDKSAPESMRIPPATMELSGTGTGEKPAITKKPKPYDEKKMGGLVGGAK